MPMAAAMAGKLGCALVAYGTRSSDDGTVYAGPALNGMRLSVEEHEDDCFLLRNGEAISWRVPRSLDGGLLDSVLVPPMEYLPAAGRTGAGAVSCTVLSALWAREPAPGLELLGLLLPQPDLCHSLSSWTTRGQAAQGRRPAAVRLNRRPSAAARAARCADPSRRRRRPLARACLPRLPQLVRSDRAARRYGRRAERLPTARTVSHHGR